MLKLDWILQIIKRENKESLPKGKNKRITGLMNDEVGGKSC